MPIHHRLFLAALGVSTLLTTPGWSQTAAGCPRYALGSAIPAPAELFSQNGVLRVTFTYVTATGDDGNTLFCFVTPDGAQSPTLHVNPGDRIVMRVNNAVPEDPNFVTSSAHHMAHAPQEPASQPDVMHPRPSPAPARCTTSEMTPASVNMHFHGTNTPATCHQDEVIYTIINSGESFLYDLTIPADEPPGLYWYHPHVHGISENAVLGGASGAIIVEGLQNVNPAAAGLAQQVLVVRDNVVPGFDLPDDAPAKDLSLNYVPVPYPKYTPAQIAMKPGERQLWRVLNADADTILDLQVTYDGQPQPLQLVGLDGVPTGSQDGTAKGTLVNVDHVLLPPAGRAEFIVTGPAATVKSALLATLEVDTGPDGDYDPARPIASIRVSGTAAPQAPAIIPPVSRTPPHARFGALAETPVTLTRKLYFSELSLDPGDPDASVIFFITVDGQTPRAFDPNNPPAIVTTAGTTEDWVIENRSQENHEFHIHQIHFLHMASDGQPVTDGQYLDTINVPYWSGTGPYPSVTLRMDFRGVTPGDFVYHCHILAHEDSGMMATIRVQAPPRN